MNYHPLNNIERWFLRRAVRKLLVQGNQQQGMEYLLNKITDELVERYTEDNYNSLASFFTAHVDSTLVRMKKRMLGETKSQAD